MRSHVLLNLFVAGYGYHDSSWKVDERGPRVAFTLDHFVEVAQLAEHGRLDSLFFADSPGVADFRTWYMAQSGFDPVDLLAALIPVTNHIGLLATSSTTYGTPWDVARRFATLDHLSGGRAGWNIVTTGNPIAAANFGDRAHPEHADRYDRAVEFVEVVRKVWDGWEDDAVTASLTTGEWADRTKLHPPAHHGEHFSVAGVLGLPRSPQGHPVLAQAGSSAEGVDLAGRFADVVFTPQASLAAGVAFRARVREAAVAHGRRADDLKTLPGLSFVLEGTESAAQAAWEQLESASSEEFRIRNLNQMAGITPDQMDGVDIDGPFPHHLFDNATGRTFGAAISRSAREEGLTFRQAARRFATLPGGLHVTGTPAALADLIETWWTNEGADGFTLQPLRLPRDLELFVDGVVPLLRERGLVPAEYGEGTLRDRLGLRRPVNRYVASE